MARAALLSVLALLPIVCSVLAGQQEVAVPLINNGPEANIQDFPFVLSLRRNGVHIGGGVIISPQWALTAAHILIGCPATQLTMRAGSRDRQLGGSLHNAQSITMHNQFEAHNLNNNIAIIAVLEPFIINGNTIRAIPLDIQGTVVPPGIQGSAAGFGSVMPATNNISPVLRSSALTVQATSVCQENLGGFMDITSNMICTTSAFHNLCHGDFGGPLVANNVLVGIASWNPFCSNTGHSTAFTRIAAHSVRNFIRTVTGL